MEKIIILAEQLNPNTVIQLKKFFDAIFVTSINTKKIKSLKTNFYTTSIPLILLLEKNNNSFIKRAIEAGIDDYLIEPYNTKSLLTRIKLTIVRSQRNLDANPLTRLPGNRAIAQILQERADKAALLHIDINNFKKYNDTYGFVAGDNIILQTAQMLETILGQYGNQTDFLGHIGGDDFVVITTHAKRDLLRKKIITNFAHSSLPSISLRSWQDNSPNNGFPKKHLL